MPSRPGIARRCARKLAEYAVVMLGVATVVFVLLRAIPGDPVLILGGLDIIDRSQIAQNRASLGLDRPMPEQYMIWIGHALRGDLGASLRSGEPVTALIGRALPVTAEIGTLALVIGLALSAPAGIAAARRAGRAADATVMTLSMLCISTPSFVLALGLIDVFSVRLRLLPSTGFVPLGGDPIGHFRCIVLPSLTLGLVSAGVLVRMMRRGVLDELGADYVRTARAKGLAESRVVRRHAARNALLPFVTLAGLEAGALLSGTVITETLFALPGLGRLMVENINHRDYPVVQGAVLVTAVLYVSLNAAVDGLYALLDPRVRDAERA